ncbi:MAG: YdeI/OmpD-associated family protein [Armatimonadota bacterium]
MGINSITDFFALGCGRCSRFQTSECSTQLWQEELALLRSTVLSAGLTEEVKWSHPCYTDQGKNIAVIGAFRDCCVLTFFKGVLLSDPAQILELPGENSQAGRVIRIRSLEQVHQLSEMIRDYLREAIDIERSGQQFEKIKIEDRPIPQELADKFDEMPELRQAFRSLTPGRQRGYLLHFSQPKQAKTREARIEKCVDQIMAGQGLND